jgi:hypothetical protein
MQSWLAEIEHLPGVSACFYEEFPFDTALPRVERGRVVLPADEPGVLPFARWNPSNGIEVPVFAGGLQIGRFVVHADVATCGIALAPDTRERLLAIASCAAVTRRDRRGRDPSAPVR